MASDKWYIYVRKDTLQIYRSSPSLELDDECHIIEIEKELGVSFVHAPHTFDDWVVYYDGEKANFIKKDKAAKAIIQFFFTPALLKEVEGPTDLTFVIRDDAMDIVLRRELIAYVANLYSAVPVDRQFMELYISERNDPNKLLEIVRFNIMDVIMTVDTTITVPFKHKLEDVSLFLRKTTFESYGLKIIKDNNADNE